MHSLELISCLAASNNRLTLDKIATSVRSSKFNILIYKTSYILKVQIIEEVTLMEEKWFTITYFTKVVEGGGMEDWSMDQRKFSRYIKSDSMQTVSDLINDEFETSKLISVNAYKKGSIILLNPRMIEHVYIQEGKQRVNW